MANKPRGRSNFWIAFAGLDAIPGSTGGVVRFNIWTGPKDREEIQATLRIPIEAKDDGLNGMMARACEKLGDALHKMLETTDKMHDHYTSKEA
jgi:hypothetical protein